MTPAVNAVLNDVTFGIPLAWGAAPSHYGTPQVATLAIRLARILRPTFTFPEFHMSMVSEFKEFALKGNVLDLAVGVVIGGAFQKIVDSMVNDIIMPFVGLLTGGVDFTNRFMTLKGGPFTTMAEAKEAGVPIVAYGAFINQIVTFLIDIGQARIFCRYKVSYIVQ